MILISEGLPFERETWNEVAQIHVLDKWANIEMEFSGGLPFCVAHGAMNLYVLILALCDPPQKDIRDHPVIGGIGPARARSGVDSGAAAPPAGGAPRLPEDEEEYPPSEEQRSSSWWRGKTRPKIADSSAWEDIAGADPI